MAGRRIRWGSVGRVGAIALAAIVGIASLPALLGGDAPPPVPADVGVAPPVDTAPSPVVDAPPPPPALPARARTPRHQPAARRRSRKGSRPHHPDPAPVAPSPPAYSPPVYSYVPPPERAEFQIEP